MVGLGVCASVGEVEGEMVIGGCSVPSVVGSGVAVLVGEGKSAGSPGKVSDRISTPLAKPSPSESVGSMAAKSPLAATKSSP